jgi:8-oxo-dGTP pyrophosphatase MutT (NUDIX family)
MVSIKIKMRKSAGILFILNNKKILLCHPTNRSWMTSFTPPKGGIEEGESILDAALRETKEEIGITVDISMINDLIPMEINYFKKDNLFKIVYLYIIHINKYEDLGLKSSILPKSKLQLEEVDWAGFLSKEECIEKISPRFLNVLDLIN